MFTSATGSTTLPTIAWDTVLSPHVYVFYAAWLVSFIFTPIMKAIASYYGIIDLPDRERKLGGGRFQERMRIGGDIHDTYRIDCQCNLQVKLASLSVYIFLIQTNTFVASRPRSNLKGGSFEAI